MPRSYLDSPGDMKPKMMRLWGRGGSRQITARRKERCLGNVALGDGVVAASFQGTQ